MDVVNFEKIISVDNLLFAWKEFLRGKRNKKDVQEFQLRLMDNVLSLHNDLKNKTYMHRGYCAFNLSDPKPILKEILKKHIKDKNILWLLNQVIDSFPLPRHIYAIADICKIGLPLGNLTSQLLVNVYMNEFDQFMKRELKVKYYIRYADDFVILSDSKDYLSNLLPKISDFLQEELKLQLHPDKVFIKTLASGVDFLGWVHFPRHRVLRTSTKRKMLKNLEQNSQETSKQSYLGILKHGDGFKLRSFLNL